MANPKSKIPVARPRSEDSLLRKSKEKDNKDVSFEPRAKSERGVKTPVNNTSDTKLTKKLNLGAKAATGRAEKDLSNHEENSRGLKSNYEPDFKAKFQGNAFVVRINRVGDRDVIVTEEIGSAWAGSFENETRELNENSFEKRVVKASCSPDSDAQSKVGLVQDSNLNVTVGDRDNFEDCDLESKSISNWSLGKREIPSRKNSISSLRDNLTPHDEPKTRGKDSKVLNDKRKNRKETNNTKHRIENNIANIKQQTEPSRPNKERLKTYRSWTPSSTNTQATYLGSYKPEKSRLNDDTTHDIIDIPNPEPQHNNAKNRHITNNIIAENTFIKDDSFKRFERIKSTESVRSHYDKRRRDKTFRISASGQKERRSKSAEANPEKEKWMLDDVKPENVNNMNLNIPDNQNFQDNQENFQKSISKLSKRRIPIRKKLPLDYDNSSQIHVTSSDKENIKNRVLETLNNRNVLNDDGLNTRLSSAEIITHDLRLVKKKVKANLMVDLSKTSGKSVLKKNLLTNFNKNKIKRLKNPVNNIFLNTEKHSALVAMDRLSPNSQDIETSNSRMGSKGSLRKTRAPEKLARKTKQHVTLKNAFTQTSWNIQPKIHRHKTTTQRRSRHPNSYPSSHNSVQTWLMNSVKSSDLHNAESDAKKNNLNSHRYVNVNDKLKNLEVSDKEEERRLSTYSDDINHGEYLPLKRLSKRPSKTKGMRRRHLGKLGKYKGYEKQPHPSQDDSEIPVLYSDEDDVYPEPRPLTDTERARYPHHRRYEGENDNFRANYRDAAHKKLGKTTGALVRFFRNGDPDHKGLPIVVNNAYRNFETLLVDLNGKIPTPTGVKYVFKWPEGSEITSVKQFQNRCVYVVSSTRQLKRNVNYGESREQFWVNKRPSAGKMRKTEKLLYKRPASPKGSPTSNSPLIVTIINNLSRDKREKVILNPQTQQTFEEWRADLNCSEIPVKTLHTEKPPYNEITSFSALFRELRVNRNFIACGDELLPLEITKKRQAPSSNSSSDSVKEIKNRRKKLPRKREDMGQIYEQERPESPSSTIMSRYDLGPRNVYGPRGRPMDNRRNLKECVEIDIGGQVKEFIPPSFLDPEDDGTKPDKTLKCEWIYGFRSKDARHNLMVLPRTGELVYYVAAVVILYDKERDTQRHYMKHNEEITCMSIHPNQYLIATGQLHGKEPEHSSHIRIWHGVSLSTYSVIGVGVFSGGILSIGFSADGSGNLMCALDGSEKHVLSVWEWQTERVIARTMTSTDPVHCCCFYPDGSNNSILITYGAKHIYFWKIFYDAARKREAKILRDRNSGIFEIKQAGALSFGIQIDHAEKNKNGCRDYSFTRAFGSEDEIPKSINCLAFLPSGHVVTGDTIGNLMLWSRDSTDAFTCSVVIQAHNSSISSLCMLEDGTLLSGGGQEIKAWDTNTNFKAVKARQIPQEAGTVRSIMTQTVGGIDGKLYIGTTNGCILDGSLQLKFRYIVQGHSEGVSGVFPHPFEPTFVTAGLDKVVIKWSLVTHKVIWKSHIESTSTCLAVDHRHELVAAGTNDGSFITLNAYNGMHVATVEVGKSSIGCLAFSPDGLLIAVGCEDGLINIYAIHDRGQRYQKFNMPMKGHNAGVAHLDWSTDGRCIQSVGEDLELIFWDVDSMQQIKIPRMMRDVDWFTNTCTIAYSLIGPWSNLEKGELMKVVNRSNYRDLMITGDTKGRLRLYKYPCSKEKGEYRQVRLYSSQVTGVAFTPDNRSVLSCGGSDGLALVQWTLTDEQ